MIELKDITLEYAENQLVKAVDHVNIEMEQGKFISIVGCSGSGKSSLLSVLGGMKKPTSGELFVDGENVYKKNNVKLAKYRREKIGFIFQSFHLEPNYTVYENIEIALMIGRYPTSKRKEHIEKLLEQVGLVDKKNMKTGKLSGGEKQRVCIARALANEPKLILADEPCGNLDTENSRQIMKLLRDCAKGERLVVLVTHNLMDAQMTDRIIELKDGAVIRDENIR